MTSRFRSSARDNHEAARQSGSDADDTCPQSTDLPSRDPQPGLPAEVAQRAESRRSFGLALSGGGFRATLFHLGVVAFLRDHGLLREVKHIASVSGGSILAAHLVQHWDAYLEEDSFRKEADKIVAFTRLDVRGRCLRRLPAYLPLTLLPRVITRRFFSSFERPTSPRNLLLARFLKRLFGKESLFSISNAQPAAPALDILATNLTQGSLSYFSKNVFVPNQQTIERIETRVPVATAVAISASFPLFFPPRRLSADDLGARREALPVSQVLTEGGVFDNLGLSRFRALLEQPTASLDWVIVSDATGGFDWEPDTDFASLFKTAVRSTDILMKRIGDLQLLSVRGHKTYRFLRISDPKTAESPQSPGEDPAQAPECLKRGPASPLADRFVRAQLKKIRTDLDAFSDLEIRTLFHHGYRVAAEQLGDLVDSLQDAPSWLPAKITRLENRGPRRVASALKRSQRRRYRFFSARDWLSYLHAALLASSAFLLFYLAHSYSERTQLVRAFAQAPKDSFGILERCDDIDQLYGRFEKAQRKWRDDVPIQVSAAVVAASRNEPANREKCGFQQEESGVVRSTLERLADLERRGKRFSDEERFHFHRLNGYTALLDANQASAHGYWDEAVDQFVRAKNEFMTAWRHRGKGLYRLEYYLCSTEVERVEMLKHRLASVEDPDVRARLDRAVESRGHDAEIHCDRSLEFSSTERRVPYWPSYLLRGKLFFLRAMLAQDEGVRIRLLEDSADQIITAHRNTQLPGDDLYFKELDGYIPEVRELCQFESFQNELGFLCEQ